MHHLYSQSVIHALIIVGLLLPGTVAAAPVNSLAAPPTSAPQVPLSLEARTAYQRAIEEVYWQHRIWPKENTGPRPALETVMPQSALQAKAEDVLLKTNALQYYWGQSIIGEQLQAELDQMAKHSQQPQKLRELWAALGNDPTVIAETLARPLLVDRLIREWYAQDDRFHGDLKARARADLEQHGTIAGLRAMSGQYAEVEWVKREAGSQTQAEAGKSVALDAQAWDARLQDLARAFGRGAEDLPIGRLSGLHEDESRFYVVAVLERGQDRLRVASVEWRKQSFEDWWQSVKGQMALGLATPAYDYRLPELAVSTCTDDTWRPTQAIPDPRYQHTAVWTGSEMIVWGGMNVVGTFPDDNGRYDPATDSWTPVSKLGAPAARAEHTAIWTGTEIIVWGGTGASTYKNGGRYNPSTDTWTPISTVGAPGARYSHTAVWTGSEMIVWGGFSGAVLNTGGRYNPSTNTWQSTPTTGAPSARYLHTAVWTGTEMIVWGGYTGSMMFNTGGRYNPATNTWQATSTVGAPSARYFHTAVWTGSLMIIWGGSFTDNIGGRYDPATDTWQPTSTVNAPQLRWLHESVWTGAEMIVWGGTTGALTHTQTGGRYNPVTDTWTPTSTVNAPAGREDLTAVWTGSEMIVWGGLGDNFFVNTGGRYNPTTNSWLPTQTYNVPVARGLHTAVWTGNEMIVWGGFGGAMLNSGGRYDPVTDSWQATSMTNVPIARENPTGVWTGSEMIVWGGDGPETNTGGRYNPATNTWQPTTLVNAPSARYQHTAVWTGSEMIIWGGVGAGNTGGRYNPATDSWAATSTANAPLGRDSHAAVWTGSEMIIWGGYPEFTVGKSGGRYNPTTDTWQATSQINAPTGRSHPAAVWTGSEAIFWGGYSYQAFISFRTGGRYNPATDTWTPTTTVGAPSARVALGVWTGKEMIIWGGVLTDSTGGRYNPLSDTWRATSLVNAPRGRWNYTWVWTGTEAIVWGGIIETATGGLYCAILEGNLPPVARNDSYSTTMNTPLVVAAPGVLANDTDGNGDPVSAVLASGPANGSLTLNADGSFTYTPNTGFAGTDSFTYQASDGQLLSNIATVTLSVSCTTNCLRSTTIILDVLVSSIRGRVIVKTESGAAASGATVSATWTLPDGSTQSQTATTNSSGLAVFRVSGGSGTYTLTITNIVKTGFTFDPVNSVLSKSVTK